MDFINELKEKFNTYNITLSDKQANQFYEYYLMLIDYNQRFNLTTITEQSEVIEKHFLDSVLPYTEIIDNATVLDVGAGAGFPSIPLKILRPDINLTMVDSLNKRIDFLEAVIEKLQLNSATALHGRCEDMAKMALYRDNFDVVVARAVAKLSTLCEYCIPFIKVNGKFFAYKSQDLENELLDSANAFTKLSIKQLKTLRFNLPSGIRNILILTKTNKTPSIYPRSQNKPRKMPL